MATETGYNTKAYFIAKTLSWVTSTNPEVIVPETPANVLHAP